MNEKIRNYEENEIIDLVPCEDEEPETSGNGVLGFVLGGLAVAAGATALVLHKTKSKREAKRIKKLEAKGYVVLRPEEADALEAVSDDYETVEE